ncbi:hypothetical protein MKJ04_15480 [Pontibacter sp. E15-1]|uniref:hypothetical protein n=1 Tax=Pontibacter sp. E15-1 TaxID=2919918 RepID=UPI001F500D65|nr:hypothetical protein [Pontibacter sp. E15-1]MCJ8166248.1 hypothetical protein [Pontibacter sp. E15-1]
MKRLCKAFVCAFLLCAGSPAAMAAGEPAAGYEQLLQQAKELLVNYKDSEALQVYEQVLAVAPENYEALCKASYLHCRIGDRFGDETSKINHFLKARQLAEQAYALNPTDAESNFVMGLSIGCQAMVEGPRQRLAEINQIKGYIDAALACDSSHAGAWHILGRWYFKMANLNFAEKLASKMLFGGISDNATNEEAAYALERAIAYSPTNIRYYYDLASVYAEMKDTVACKSVLEKAIALRYETKEELELSRRCKIMLQQQHKS